ncbi:MAG: VCBS repeat-containing protein [Spirulinaceae cyanobacterium]
MKSIKTLAGLIFGISLLASPTLAATELEINRETILNEELSDGTVRVIVNYELIEDRYDAPLKYQIFYGETLYVDTSEETTTNSAVKLDDINNDGTNEVIISTYSGGAHCCTTFSVYTWQGDGFAKATTGYLDGGAGRFEDLDGNGTQEFSSFDNAFFYAFGPYVTSFPPLMILSLENGRFVDTTQQFPQEMEGHAWQMYLAIREWQSQGYGVNNVLASYVAQKILLGEFEEGWEFMLANYDRDSDWGLEISNDQGDVIGTYTDFPTALRAFLQDLGYLLPDGSPNPSPSRVAKK